MTGYDREVHGALVAGVLLIAGTAAGAAPRFREFMGINGHTVQFRPALYAPCVRLVRDYHPTDWDTGADPATSTTFPLAKNGVDWAQVYGSWKAGGFTTDACLMLDMFKPEQWKNPEAAAYDYGFAFARAFGPSSATPLVSSVEIGNEPGKLPDDLYRRIFTAMAVGVRAGDPKLSILPCNLTLTKSGEYAKSADLLRGLEHLYDVLNLHVYAEAEPWPTWRRSYPEDPAIPYLREVTGMLAWRDTHAPGKPVWVTEFGWDCTTQTPKPGNEFEKWVGVSDLQQARYLVRSFMVFARLGVERAYIFFFNDEDEPKLHAGAGLTRKWQPKPSYHAVSHLLGVLGDYRFDAVIEERVSEVYAYRFIHADDPKRAIVAVWSPTGSDRTGSFELSLEGRTLGAVTKMPLTAKAAAAPKLKPAKGRVRIPVDESPVFVELKTN